ncbi:hypothetical protein SCT_1714 [Sulfuricella sp. T08]|uniref:DUF4160 domain-containing protein n=1 Tax=Sulfuricella sp. T08 TaxID=1632857 RepID=UPI000617972B|nr:DUF4160 domain-containing protein [Sulfuricella sp. T08]GAO36308.1 hypothetical protein SCT_1714 [Sulfuricella sp. T08]
MPKVLEKHGFRFFFFSGEGQEPPHIHVEHGDKVAKYWLQPVELASSEGFRAHELSKLRMLVIEHRNLFLEKWHEHFGR